ncbi:LAMI_0C05732g1_1 [Lachancea mirantina]|uniref:LAMI_0C05732g1_1 n=1 Tax=Lachancea mirantina TaxID=1230905 RepID=A0A1G4J2Q9_9SACH|nr:LAMI_0C05732g1_1 [Lachancea mirantina]
MAPKQDLALDVYFKDVDPRLSEGITYLAASKTLLWVDIFKGEIHRVTDIDNPRESHKKLSISARNYDGEYTFSKEYPERVGVVFPVDGADSAAEVDEVYFAAKYGIGRGRFSTNQWQYVLPFSLCKAMEYKDPVRLRSNDGNVAPNGDIYVGLMTDFHVDLNKSNEAEGCVLCINLKRGTVDLVWDHIYIPNSINWNPSHDTLYLTDSLNFKVWQMPYVNGTAQPDHKRVFVDFEDLKAEFESPEPDGSVVDVRNGNFVTAVFSTHKIQVYSSSAQLLRELSLTHTPAITCCVFGPNGDLFVTTASADVQEGKDLGPGGGLFRIPAKILGFSETGVQSSKRAPEL